MLVISALHDPVTPYSHTVHVAAQLGRSGALLTYGGEGHAQYGTSTCVSAATDNYLISLTIPPQRAFCPTVPLNASAVRGAAVPDRAGAGLRDALLPGPPTGQRLPTHLTDR